MNALPTTIVGAKGRMGLTLCAVAAEEGCRVVAQIDAGDDLAQGLLDAKAAIDFSTPKVTAQLAALAARAGLPLVVGTTGLDASQEKALHQAAKKIPVVFAPNFSVGVNTLFWLVSQAAKILGPDFDAEIIEIHHRFKKDSPSGTAKRLGELVAEAKGYHYERDTRHGRQGIVGERPTCELGMHAVRGGDVVGDHTVLFAAAGERLELIHRASSRETFARGALRAAKWAAQQPSGLYSMQDVLGLHAL